MNEDTKSWERRQGFPLGRIFLVGLLLWQAYVHRSLWWPSSSSPKEVDPVLHRAEEMVKDHGKAFHLPAGQLQESWIIKNPQASRKLAQYYRQPEVQELISLVLDSAHFPGKLDVIFPLGNFQIAPLLLQWQDSLRTALIVHLKVDPQSTTLKYFDARTRCVWGEPCPVEPLAGGALPIDKTFDFAGREDLIDQDLFQGIGEAPVHAVLGGWVQKIDTIKASQLLAVEVLHPGNLISRYSGLAKLDSMLCVGMPVDQGFALGRLSARDTTSLHFRFRRDGIFVRWNDLLQSSRPLTDSAFDENLKGLLQ